jgi:hypothetical protein
MIVQIRPGLLALEKTRAHTACVWAEGESLGDIRPAVVQLCRVESYDIGP